jgi:cytochrome c-type biogenesis protein CcmH/NrfG
MPLIRNSALAILVMALTACAVEPGYNRYQVPAGAKQPGQGAVVELHDRARDALDRQAYQKAVDYLQRAIKIEPRNPHSWHYLARAYWRSGDYRRCLEMADRSFSYSASEDGLDHDNRELMEKCRQG